MKLSTIRSKIEEQLLTLTWVWQPFDFVYDYHTLENQGYPYISFEPSLFNSAIEDTCENKRKYTFDLFIYQEFETIWRSEALWYLINWHEEIIDLFEKNYTLDWIAIQVLPLNAVFSEIPWDKWKVLFNNIQLEVEFLYNIT